MTVKKVEIIKPNAPLLTERIKVAVYARVSQEGEMNEHSLKAQVDYYSKVIAANPKWENVGIFADYGTTGTATARPGFQNLIALCDAGKAELVFTDANGNETRKTIMQMKGPGIIQGIHNLDKSIESFARCCFRYALDEKVDVWFATKDTISKTYDGRFKEIFQQVFDAEFKAEFEKAGLTYFYTLIDDAVARVMRSEGGFMWATKNYDGDVMSDMIASACGSLAMMTSVLVSPDGNFEYEASHGTVQKHYYRYLKGEKTSTNPVATIFAWTGALAKRGEMDGTPELVDFAKKLEKATLSTIEEGYMTGDLASLAEPKAKQILNSWEFIAAIKERLEKAL